MSGAYWRIEMPWEVLVQLFTSLQVSRLIREAQLHPWVGERFDSREAGECCLHSFGRLHPDLPNPIVL